MKQTRHFAYALFATLLLSAPSQALDAWTTVDSVEGGSLREIISDRNGVLFTAGVVDVSEGLRMNIVRRSLDQGSSWETVLAVSEAEGFPTDLAAGPGAEVYALCTSSEPLSGRVLRTTDQGQTWQEMTRPPEGYSYSALDCAGHGTLYICAFSFGEDNDTWITLKGTVTDAGQGTISWSPIDTFERHWTTHLRPLALATRPNEDGAGPSEIWVGGVQSVRWQMRRSLDDGMTWSTMPVDQDGYIHSMAFGSDGTIYAAGTTSFHPSWIVRVSRDGGMNWSVADIVSGSQTPEAIATGASGLVLAAGGATVRASTDHGLTWFTSDQLGPGWTLLRGITVDPSGNAFACGVQFDSEGSSYWGFVRRLPAPVAAPMLSFRSEPTSLILTWPTSAIGFALQSAAALANGGDWQELDVVPTLEGDQYAVTVERASGARFFRLRKP